VRRVVLIWPSVSIAAILCASNLAAIADDQGIPVTDPLVLAKCAPCHLGDDHARMARISWSRATPEGWQKVVRRMILEHDVSVSAAEAQAIVKNLSNSHGLAPAEAALVRYSPERRSHPDENIPNDEIRTACARCHAFAVPLSWRRSSGEWKEFVKSHAARQKFSPSDELVDRLSNTLSQIAPLATPKWESWRNRDHSDLVGRWLLTAALPGRGKYWGETQIERTPSGDFTTRTTLTSITDGSILVRNGRGVVYGDYAWRGRSSGASPASAAPGDPLAEAREVMSFSAASTSAEGRWFWGQYQEFGFDVHWQRDSPNPALLALNRSSMQTGSRGNRVRFVGYNFPVKGTPADLDLGPGVVIRAIVSQTPHELVADVDVASDAPLGKRSVVLYKSTLPAALAIYDRIDYVKVSPDSAVASFSDSAHPKGYLQFESIAYQRGPDGKMHTADDLELGPIEVTWSLQLFHAPEDSEAAGRVGTLNAAGLFSPAEESPNISFDVWVSATAKNETRPGGKALVGKAYLVVTPPTYTFSGRRYVRDLDRWVDDGPVR
jgi:quinohemoprotein amine dehydrogenase